MALFEVGQCVEATLDMYGNTPNYVNSSDAIVGHYYYIVAVRDNNHAYLVSDTKGGEPINNGIVEEANLKRAGDILISYKIAGAKVVRSSYV